MAVKRVAVVSVMMLMREANMDGFTSPSPPLYSPHLTSEPAVTYAHGHIHIHIHIHIHNPS